jgi:hypothetical protein
MGRQGGEGEKKEAERRGRRGEGGGEKGGRGEGEKKEREKEGEIKYWREGIGGEVWMEGGRSRWLRRRGREGVRRIEMYVQVVHGKGGRKGSEE